MKKKLLALMMGTALVLAACGGGDEAADDKATKDGEETTTASGGDAEKLYNQKCLQCHGENLEGGAGPALDKVGADLSKEDIETIIAEGKGIMPAGALKGEEASTVADWLAAKK
ncbi:cytochrome C551 [Bacillus canaveralius]|uniref:Cytochrome C551 n=1 Tax=Bacillus canaveralius TaxID=1403243 RepID=A0A2N5GMK5_9BACI|nr:MULTISPECIES: cytochrome c [Bacillus]PLR82564.1 cytochrome C551 [Bacillus sp. V33-4]PLR83178.1 cytochrome C551 [Bacillus canaveralius]PLR94096.1 cytochrome C551 [Bacillus canaveralius]RSK54104.1 cytochrome c [Bacillus canaveralius]